MNKVIKLLAVGLLVSLFSGCATVTNMPLKKDVSSLDTSKKTVLVGRIKVKNKNKINQQPELLVMSAKKKEEDLSFNQPTLISATPKVGKDYIFSMAVEPGEITLGSVTFMRQNIFTLGTGAFDLNKKINIPSNKIVYIGNIEANIVPRKENEPRAGSLIPLVDQAVTGFSSGTFKVDIKDNYNEDIALMRKTFPYLANKEITKMVLSKWVYTKPQ